MLIFGRRVIPTTLDPVPRNFRAAPGVIALNQIELDAIHRNAEDDREIIKPILEAIQAEDMADAMRVYVHKPRKITRATPKMRPSDRMSMLNAIYRGRHE